MTLPFAAMLITYNHEPYLERAIRALLDQTRPLDRIYVMSDGSTDRTLEIARDLLGADARVKWAPDLSQNKGLMPRIIEAHAALRGHTIVPASGDDAWDLSRVAIHEELMRDGSEWSIGATWVCDANLEPVRLWDPSEDIEKARPGPRRAYRAILEHWPALVMHGWAYTASYFERSGGVDPRYRFEDYPLGLRFAWLGEPRVTSRPVNNYRVLRTGLANNAKNYGIALDFARATLAEVSRAPALSLRLASSRFAQASDLALRQRGLSSAALWGLASAALWPTPRTVASRTLSLARGTAGIIRDSVRGGR